MYSSKIIGNVHKILNFNQLFLKLNRFICNQETVLPVPLYVVSGSFTTWQVSLIWNENVLKNAPKTSNSIILLLFNFFGTQEALDHLASFPSGRETISQTGIKLPSNSYSRMVETWGVEYFHNLPKDLVFCAFQRFYAVSHGGDFVNW